jgi:hypothetical protein
VFVWQWLFGRNGVSLPVASEKEFFLVRVGLLWVGELLGIIKA